MRDPGEILILGAGPTGLGAAYRLHEAGHDRFTVLEARGEPGGLASSYVDPQGFVWDVGGHVQFQPKGIDIAGRTVAGGKGQPVSGGRANGRRSPDDHFPDGRGYRPVVDKVQIDRLVG